MQKQVYNYYLNARLENETRESGNSYMCSSFELDGIDPATFTLVVNSQVENVLFNIEDDTDIDVTDVEDEYDPS